VSRRVALLRLGGLREAKQRRSYDAILHVSDDPVDEPDTAPSVKMTLQADKMTLDPRGLPAKDPSKQIGILDT
jgi:hypothetical protein